MNKHTKCHMCNVCVFIEDDADKVGFYCKHKNFVKPKLIIERPRYQLGIRSPRWCPKKEKK